MSMYFRILFERGDVIFIVASTGQHPGPKSHEISLKNLTQIFSKSSYDPRRRYEAHRRRDIKKISLRVLFKIFRRSSNKFFLRSSWDLKKIFWRFIRRLTEDFIRRSSEDLLSIFDHLTKIFKFFFKLKIKKKTRRFSVDLKKISDEDLLKISKRFELKILQRSPKDLSWRSFKDLKKILWRNCLKIFQRKLMKIFRRFLEEKVLNKIFIKSFLLKIFKRFSEEIQRRSSEEWDLVKIFIKDLREISFFGRSQKRFGSWAAQAFNKIWKNKTTVHNH